MADHSILSPSSMERIIACPPSALENAGRPDQESEYAAQGTDAHALCEAKLREYLGEKVRNPREDLTWYDQEMEDCTDDYMTFVAGQIMEARAKCKDPAIMVEQKLDMTEYGEGMFGTADCVIVADENLHIIDFKYGKGVQVDATNNFQEMTYAVCCLETFGDLYDFEEVVLCIYQPRLNSISEWTIKVSELKEWVETVLKPGVKASREGSVEFHPGKHCQFCKAKPFCKALRDKNLELAKHEFRPAFLLDDDEIEEVLLKADEFINWINSVKDYALSEAIHGKRYKALKLVEGRSTRKFSSEADVARVVQEAGYDPFEHKLLSITDMTSLLGKTQFNELLSKFIVRTKPKLALVKRDDKRPEVTSAEADFKDIDD